MNWIAILSWPIQFHRLNSFELTLIKSNYIQYITDRSHRKWIQLRYWIDQLNSLELRLLRLTVATEWIPSLEWHSIEMSCWLNLTCLTSKWIQSQYLMDRNEMTREWTGMNCRLNRSVALVDPNNCSVAKCLFISASTPNNRRHNSLTKYLNTLRAAIIH